MPYTYEYFRPMVTTDIIVINKFECNNNILLIKRLNNPYKDYWALPGGFVDENESLLDAAKRELKEETSIDNLELKQFKAYGDKNRDPRGHCVSIVFYGINKNNKIKTKAGDDAKEAKWFNLDHLPKLAFDHDEIILEAKANIEI